MKGDASGPRIECSPSEAPDGVNPPKASDDSPCHVMVVDDSAIARGIVTRTLAMEPGINVVASAANGLMALKAMRSHRVDVIVLDIEMPGLDGMETLPRLLEIDPDLKVIMASSLSRRNADISLRAISLGACDYVPKPSSGLGGAEEFRRELVQKVLAHAAMRKRSVRKARVESVHEAVQKPVLPKREVKSIEKPSVIAIGSSTGGPQALAKVLTNLDQSIDQPIVITQHMPATFTALLAEHMTRYAGREAAEARDGEPLMPRRIYVAPGGKHLLLEPRAGGAVVRLDDGPPENSCKPAVDPMLRSLAPIYKSRVLTVILTGMGIDGLKGCREVVREGGIVLAQDQASSVVWGMPGAVAQAGLCRDILPLAEIRSAIGKIARGESI